MGLEIEAKQYQWLRSHVHPVFIRSSVGRTFCFTFAPFFSRLSICALRQLTLAKFCHTTWLGRQKNFCYANFVKEPPIIFRGKNVKFRRFFSAAHVQMALPNVKCNRKSKTKVYYGDVWSMFRWTLMGVWWILGRTVQSKNTLCRNLVTQTKNRIPCITGYSNTESLMDCGRY